MGEFLNLFVMFAPRVKTSLSVLAHFDISSSSVARASQVFLDFIWQTVFHLNEEGEGLTIIIIITITRRFHPASISTEINTCSFDEFSLCATRGRYWSNYTALNPDVLWTDFIYIITCFIPLNFPLGVLKRKTIKATETSKKKKVLKIDFFF